MLLKSQAVRYSKHKFYNTDSTPSTIHRENVASMPRGIPNATSVLAWHRELEQSQRRIGPLRNQVACQASQSTFYCGHVGPMTYHRESQYFVCEGRRRYSLWNPTALRVYPIQIREESFCNQACSTRFFQRASDRHIAAFQAYLTGERLRVCYGE